VRFDRAVFFANYRDLYGKLKQGQVDGLDTLLGFLELDADVSDIRWAAYMLATVKHECADTFQPIVERGPRSYFDKYEPNTALGKRLGNKVMGDGFRTKGRGYVMLTGLDNYLRMNRLLELAGTQDNIVVDPDNAMKPSIAYRIMSVGMRRGVFTGKKLGDYIAGEKRDYLNARRVINILDRAALIAGYATHFEVMLLRSATR
jgi:putative chitinase